jgi:hypothetical protein
LARNAATATLWASTGFVGRVGLAALAGGEHPDLGGQLRWHVHHGFTVGDQSLRGVPADAVAAFHRPYPLRVAPAEGTHRPVAVPVGAEPAARQYGLPVVDDLDRRRPLVRIHPDDDSSHATPPRCDRMGFSEEGNATSSWTDPS